MSTTPNTPRAETETINAQTPARYEPRQWPSGNGWQVYDTHAARFLDGIGYHDRESCAEACKGWNGGDQ